MQPEIPLQNLISFGVEGIFYLFLLFFAIHLLIVSYHWFTYGTSKLANMTALFIYVGGSVLTLLIMFISLIAI